jgi:hypothetical protein
MSTDYIELRAALKRQASRVDGRVEIKAIELAELLAAYDALRSGGSAKRGKKEYPAEFLAAYDAMKEAGGKWREGSTLAAAFKQWQARLKAGADPEQIVEGVRRYGAYIAATAGEPKMAQTFFGPGEHYTAEWAIARSGARRFLPDRRAPQPETPEQMAARRSRWGLYQAAAEGEIADAPY